MTILVTGGAGYIGSHIVLELLAHDERVVVVDNLSTGFDWALPDEVPLETADIGDRDRMADILADHAITEVIHLAGSSVIPDSIADPHAYYANNSVATHALLGACLEAGVKHFIFSSTAAVYGTVSREPVLESAATLPNTPYGRSKLMSEMMLADIAAASSLTYTALRYFNVAGADPKGRIGQSTVGATHLIKVACEAATGKRGRLLVFGTGYDTPDGTCVRDFIHVSDLASAHYLALQRLRNGGENLVANAGYGIGFSVRQVADIVGRLGGELAIETVAARTGDEAHVVADPALLKAETGWVPEHDDLETIIGHSLRWEQKLQKRNRVDQS